MDKDIKTANRIYYIIVTVLAVGMLAGEALINYNGVL